MDNFSIDVETLLGEEGATSWPGITIDADIVELRNGSAFRSNILADGNSGEIHVTAREYFLLSDDPSAPGTELRPSGLYTNALFLDPELGNQGRGGDIVVETPNLTILGGARFDSSTQTSGRGSNIFITSDSISIAGQRDLPFNEVDVWHRQHASKRSLRTLCCQRNRRRVYGSCGAGGKISIITRNLNMTRRGSHQ